VCWFEKKIQLLNRERKDIKEHFPALKFYTYGKTTLSLAGKIDLKDEGNNVVDTYEIEIIFPKKYPEDYPFVREIGWRLPRILDRHIVGENGFCCLAPRLAIKKVWDKSPKIISFINILVIPFLANQSYYERIGEWKNGEYGHGAKGIIEYYSQEFGFKDQDVLLKTLKNLSENVKIGRNDKCICGSNKKAKKCHLGVYEKLRNEMCPALYKLDLSGLEKNIKEENKHKEKANNVETGDLGETPVESV